MRKYPGQHWRQECFFFSKKGMQLGHENVPSTKDPHGQEPAARSSTGAVGVPGARSGRLAGGTSRVHIPGQGGPPTPRPRGVDFIPRLIGLWERDSWEAQRQNQRPGGHRHVVGTIEWMGPAREGLYRAGGHRRTWTSASLRKGQEEAGEQDDPWAASPRSLLRASDSPAGPKPASVFGQEEVTAA